MLCLLLVCKFFTYLDWSVKSFVLYYSDLLKQSRHGCNPGFLELFAYPPDRRWCVIFVLKHYLARTAKLRNNLNCNKLFISYVKSFWRVSRETISRWLKTVMCRSRINMNLYSTHSIRSASVSKAYKNLIPVDMIMNRAGWTNANTFAKFYNKPIETDDGRRFQNAVLRVKD